MTDALKIIGENTSRFAGGSALNVRYMDLIEPKLPDNRTGEDVLKEVVKRTGIKVVKKDEPV